MTVEILARRFGILLDGFEASDNAYDVQVRRVFLRAGFAARDDVDHMIAVARDLHPERPGALDVPTCSSVDVGVAPPVPTGPAVPSGRSVLD